MAGQATADREDRGGRGQVQRAAQGAGGAGQGPLVRWRRHHDRYATGRHRSTIKAEQIGKDKSCSCTSSLVTNSPPARWSRTSRRRGSVCRSRYSVNLLRTALTNRLRAVAAHPSVADRALHRQSGSVDCIGGGRLGRSGSLWVVNDAVRAAGLTSQSIAQLIQEAKVDFIKVPELTNIFSTTEATNNYRQPHVDDEYHEVDYECGTDGQGRGMGTHPNLFRRHAGSVAKPTCRSQPVLPTFRSRACLGSLPLA